MSAQSPPSAHPEPPPIRGVFGIVTSRPVAITMFFLAIAVFGVVSLGKLPLDLLPEISYPTLTVRTVYPGAAPEDVEDRISERVQEALSTLPDLVRSTSISRAETSDVVLEFDWGTSMTFAVQDVRDKLDGVFLPRGAERPLILRYDPSLDPILRIGLTSARPQGEDLRELTGLRWTAEHRIKRELEALPGVAAVLVRGGLVEEIRVSTDPFKMAAQGLDPALLQTRLAQENLNASGGMIREGSTEYLVRTLNEFQDVEEIADLALARRGDATIRVRDIATVLRTHAEREVVSRIDGREAVEIAVYREAGSNIVDLADTIKSAVFGTQAQQEFTARLVAEGRDTEEVAFAERAQSEYMAWRLRKDLDFELLSDQSTFIRAAVDEVKSNAISGACLAVIVILAFLRRFSSTLVIAVSIPISVVVTFAPMFMADVSLNIMSLGGLALGVGMLVDNAIVVLESITRCRDDGDSLSQAAVRGVREVAGAITASTLTTVAVFAPIVFVHGVAGQIFGDQALTVVTSLMVSLLVAVVFIPMLASRAWLAGVRSMPVQPPPPAAGLRDEQGRLPARAWPRLGGRLAARGFGFVLRALAVIAWALFRAAVWLLTPARIAFDAVWGAIERGYPPLLERALRARWIVLLCALGLFGLALERLRHVGVELLPEIHQGEFTALVTLDVGSPIEHTDTVLRDVAARVQELPDVAGTALTVGVESDTLTREIEGKHTGRLTVRLERDAASAEGEEACIAAVRAILSAQPDVRSVDVSRPTPFALEAPITVEVLGHDLERLAVVGGEVYARVSAVPGLSDVRSTVRPGHPEARVVFDRDKTLEFGLDLASVSSLVRDAVLGNVSTRFNEGEERIDVRVQGDEVLLSNLERVFDMVVNPGSETPVELRSVARVDYVQGPAEIRRIGNTRAVVVTAAGSGLDLGKLSSRIEQSLATLETPDDVAVQLGGQKREMEAAQDSMVFALLLALFLVYVVMACQFESLVQPLIILLTAPLALIGVAFALDLSGIPLSVIVFLGLILLAGIVVNNAIVLVDRINQQRAAGMALHEAILEAGHTRLRPILMTTGTTVIGLVPLTGWLAGVPFLSALGGGVGAEIRAPMAVTVIAGLSVSTLLTLFVIPVVYSIVIELTPRAREDAA
jgi:HAE1 family hydrophobic/amphiphilic exporter-1